MSVQLQKKKVASGVKTEEVELQPLINNPTPLPQERFPIQPPVMANPFSYFSNPAPGGLSPQPIYYPPPSLQASYEKTMQPLSSPFSPQAIYYNNQSLGIPQSYSIPPASVLKNTVLPSQQAFSSSVLSPFSPPLTTPQNLYPVLEQPSQKKDPKAEIVEKAEKGKTKENIKVVEKEKEKKVVDPSMLTTEEIITKRCKRCSQYYVESELALSENKTPCKYHPGTLKTGYSSTLIAGARLQYWTCCKSGNKNDPGCKSGKHIEDKQMTSIQLRNHVPLQTPKIGVLIDFAPPSIEAKEVEPKKPEKTKNLIRHYVTDADTLIGLSFRYHVSAQSIRQLNRMATDDVQGYSKLYIPRNGSQINLSEIESDSEEEEEGPPTNLSPAEKALFEKRMLMKMRAQTGISNEEASYYLNMYGWAYNMAVKEYQEDLEWEKNHKRLPARKCK